MVVTFKDGTDIYFARQVVNERLGTVELPQGIERPQMGPVSTGLGEVFHYVLTYEGYDFSKMPEEVLIKGGIYVEAPARLQAMAFDKTGTLTEGRPRVLEVVPLSRHDEKELLERIAAMESRSNHPLAQAIVAYAQHRGVAFAPADDFQSTKLPSSLSTRSISFAYGTSQSTYSSFSAIPYSFLKWSAYGGDVSTRLTLESGMPRRTSMESAWTAIPSSVLYNGFCGTN